jgi:hypothetical protein
VVPNASTEIELLKDIDGDGKPEVLFGGDGALEYPKPDPANPTAPWIVHQISEKSGVNPHGMGIGDINQERDPAGNISFVRHDIMGDFSSRNAGNVTFPSCMG